MSSRKKQKRSTPSTRFYKPNKRDLDKCAPESSLTEYLHNKKGRNCYGRITSRRRGGGHKRRYRKIDFKRDKHDIPSKIISIQYDPYRSADIALLAYADGEKRYILAPAGLKVGDKIITTLNPVEDYYPGMCLTLENIPPSSTIHCIEFQPGRGAQLVRSAGGAAQLVGIEGNFAIVKMPSGEIRKVNKRSKATLGKVGNETHSNQNKGKAGRNRWLRKRPRVRGVAMNPVDHPMGGGEGRTSGGGHPSSPWGQLSKGYPTRKKSKPTNKMILVRRNGRKLKVK